MKRAQLLQYAIALIVFAIELIRSPEVREMLASHPWAVVALLASPSFVTLLGAARDVLARRRAALYAKALKDLSPEARRYWHEVDAEANTDRDDAV